jgi:hypothetical protein
MSECELKQVNQVLSDVRSIPEQFGQMGRVKSLGVEMQRRGPPWLQNDLETVQLERAVMKRVKLRITSELTDELIGEGWLVAVFVNLSISMHELDGGESTNLSRPWDYSSPTISFFSEPCGLSSNPSC